MMMMIMIMMLMMIEKIILYCYIICIKTTTENMKIQIRDDSLLLCVHLCMYVCMYVCLYVCIYVCMHVCMHVYISALHTHRWRRTWGGSCMAACPAPYWGAAWCTRTAPSVPRSPRVASCSLAPPPRSRASPVPRYRYCCHQGTHNLTTHEERLYDIPHKDSKNILNLVLEVTKVGHVHWFFGYFLLL